MSPLLPAVRLAVLLTLSAPAHAGDGAPAPLEAAMGVAHGFVAPDGVRLSYLDFGGVGDPVVLLAGLGNNARIWSDFGPRLAQAGFRVVALSRRGHGESDAPDGDYALETLSADVVALMDVLSLPRAHLVGHSLGGAEVTHVAATWPDRVLRVVYVDAAYDRAAQQRFDAIVSMPEVAPDLTPADRASVAHYLAYQRRARPDLDRCWGPAVEQDYAASLTTDAEGSVRWRHPFGPYAAIVADVARAAPDYAGVEAPALALYATVSQAIVPPDANPELRGQFRRFEIENNRPWTAASIKQFRSEIPDGRVRRIHAVHHLFLDAPEVTLRVVVRFLSAAP